MRKLKDSIFSLSVKGEILEDNIDDKHFSILDESAAFDKAPQENRMHLFVLKEHFPGWATFQARYCCVVLVSWWVL